MTQADEGVRRLLDYLEPRIDLAHVEKVAELHRAALNYEPVDWLPLVCWLPYEGESFTPYPYPEAFADPAKMLVNELLTGFTSIYHAVDLKDDTPYCLRPNGCRVGEYRHPLLWEWAAPSRKHAGYPRYGLLGFRPT